ncbi:DUF6081 family protein [Thermomonospora umbrina]|uniref:Polysaccharide lyase-like protein n=1 Tax=Thermomonospora umbrina TaxID=111806 RepID=A0A3D9SXD0_9ACTN|nr:DUF6081 family protein [Thermomonospora umbrina]REE96261.1 hypothetical protein DFJ69_1691 [Thermomonospora umbrina]
MTGRVAIIGRRGTAVSAVAATVVLAAFGGTAAAAPSAPAETTRVLFRDDFTSGFDTSSKWMLQPTKTPTGTLAHGDGVAITSGDGLTVTPTGRNPRTGEPAFASTNGQDSTEWGGGTSDHLKWLAQPRESSVNGFPVPEQGSLTCTSRMGVRTLGVDRHPFGRAAVSDPQSDPRLASATLISVDHENHSVANFSVTNTQIFAVYERLRVDEHSDFAGFNYSIPVAKTRPGKINDLQIRYDQGGKRVSWLVNGTKVLSTDRIGTLAFPREHLVIDEGGTEEQVTSRNVQCLLSTGNLLDGAGRPQDRDKRGLVQLAKDPGHYFAPLKGEPHRQEFLDTRSLPTNRLWGQGVILNQRLFEMTTEE